MPIALGTIDYSQLVALGSVALGRFTSSWSTWDVRLFTVKPLGPTLTSPGYRSCRRTLRFGSSRATPCTITHGSRCGSGCRSPPRSSPGSSSRFAVRAYRAARIERRAQLLIAAPLAPFVLVAHLPRDLGQIGLHEQGQYIAESWCYTTAGCPGAISWWCMGCWATWSRPPSAGCVRRRLLG